MGGSVSGVGGVPPHLHHDAHTAGRLFRAPRAVVVVVYHRAEQSVCGVGDVGVGVGDLVVVVVVVVIVVVLGLRPVRVRSRP